MPGLLFLRRGPRLWVQRGIRLCSGSWPGSPLRWGGGLWTSSRGHPPTPPPVRWTHGRGAQGGPSVGKGDPVPQLPPNPLFLEERGTESSRCCVVQCNGSVDLSKGECLMDTCCQPPFLPAALSVVPAAEQPAPSLASPCVSSSGCGLVGITPFNKLVNLSVPGAGGTLREQVSSRGVRSSLPTWRAEGLRWAWSRGMEVLTCAPWCCLGADCPDCPQVETGSGN